MESAAKKKNSLAMGVVASMIVWSSALLFSSAANASSVGHVGQKSRAEVSGPFTAKSVEHLDANPANATRYYDVLEGVALECTVAPVKTVASRTPVKLAEAGEDLFVGGYGQVRRANIKSGLNPTHTPHHSVQDAVSSTSHSTGVSINMRKDLHALTRTFRKPVEEGLSLRQHLFKDVWDVKKILTNANYDRSVINAQLKELIRQNKAVGGFGK
jgi:hypothetical protein